MTINQTYEIGDRVFHITSESPEGIVLNWQYNHRENSIVYLVAFGCIESKWYYEEELSETKTF